MKQVFILLGRNIDSVMGLYGELQAAAKKWGDICLMCHNTPDSMPDEIKDVPCYSFTNDILYSLQYVPMRDKLVPGSNHFPLLQFYLQHPFYDYYWYIEDDVRFLGDWEYFFSFITHLTPAADFSTCHIRTYQEEPKWCWWNTLVHERHCIPFYLRIRSFNPIIRISNAALRCIHQVLLDRWSGHHEVLIPTMLCLEGFTIMDFGGMGQFVRPGLENKFYTNNEPNIYGDLKNGTMRASLFEQPIARLDNKLYHPIKNAQMAIMLKQ